MRKLLTCFFILMMATTLTAQVRTGNIFGTVVDSDGNALPGVTVTLTGSMTAPLTSISSAEGKFRFISLPAGSDYVVKAELEGFKTDLTENVIVTIGVNVDLTVTMQMGALSEEVTVTAVTPVVDTKKTTVAQTVNRETLQSLPTARDPWVVMQQAPGVMIDRENVGGSESGQQSTTMAKGGGQDQWSMDGVTITDHSSISSPGYYDFDAFEEMNITLGGADVSVQGAGIQMNLVTRRGGNKPSIGGRFYLTDEKFQADNLSDELIAEGVIGTNRIRRIKDFGFNAGGPLLQDKVWWWVSYGVQDINNANLYGVYEATMLNNYAAKLNIQLIPDNRLEVFGHVGGKEKTARSSSYSFPGGWHQSGAFYFGSPILKLQDEHMFGDNLFVSAKFAYSNSGFNMIPEDDLNQVNMVYRNVEAGIWENSYNAYLSIRPLMQYSLQASYFNDNLLGVSHEWKVGFEYADRGCGTRYSMPGNALTRYNYHTRHLDFNGDNVPDFNSDLQRVEIFRAAPLENYTHVDAYTAFLQDTVTIGRLNLNLGLRWDSQTPYLSAYTIDAMDASNPAIADNFSPGAIQAIENTLPGLAAPEVKPDYKWSYITPRLGATYDLTGDGKTIVKASFGQYREFMGTYVAEWFSPRGTGGWMDFWWADSISSLGGNGNGIVDLNELYWNYYAYGDYSPQRVFNDSGNLVADYEAAQGDMWDGYDINNPQATSHSRYYLENAPAQRTSEMIVSVEREILPDFGMAVDFSYRKFDNFRWDLQYVPGSGETQDQGEYTQAGTIPSSIPGYDLGEGAGKPYYLYNDSVPYRYYRLRTERKDYYRDYMAFEVRATKRLSNRWMFNGSFTYQMNNVHYGDAGFMNPTNMWALDNQIYSPEMGGSSGKVDTPFHQTWMAKFSGLYQLPLDFNVSFTANARQGNPNLHTLTIVDYNAPNPLDDESDVYLDAPDTFRLPNFFNLNLRLEKIIRIGDGGRMYMMADLFNVFNSNTMLRRYEQHHGTYYPDDGSFAVDATDNMANEILNPRVVRLGVRFQF